MLARSVCAEVLRQDDRARVHVLVQSRAVEQAGHALAKIPADDRARVEVVAGDAAHLDLGLSGAEYQALAREVTHVHHCAHVTKASAERKVVEAANLGGTREALEFARACTRLQCMVMHSTAHVAGDRRGIVREDELKVGQSFRSVIEETRARAEKLVRAEMDRLPIAIVRPATMVGDSTTGEIDSFEGPYLLVMLVVNAPPDLALPLPGGGDQPLNLVPVDWVAEAAVAIGRDARARGRTFHLVDPRPLSTRRVFELVARAGGRRGPMGSIPTNLARAVLRVPIIDRIARSPRALLETMATPVSYDVENANDLLGSLGVAECPAFESYVEKLVEFARKHVRRRRSFKGSAAASSGDLDPADRLDYDAVESSEPAESADPAGRAEGDEAEP
jgi:thioester reductase-like protein